MAKKTNAKRSFTPRKGAVRALRAIRKYAKDNNLSAQKLADISGLDYKTVWHWLSYSSADHNVSHNNEEMINLFLEDAKNGKVKLDGRGEPRRLEVQEELDLVIPEPGEPDDELAVLRRKAQEQELLLEAYRTGRLS